MSLIDFFIDPVLRGPTWGTLFMCIASGLIGSVLLLRKKTLLAESLSHAAYPGVILGVSLFALAFPAHEEWAFVSVLAGASFSAFLALKGIEWLMRRKVSPDAALCFILAVFFGAGIVAASSMQSQLPSWHQKTQMLLFGQAATMTGIHVALYGGLALSIALFFLLMYRPLQSVLFDRDFSSLLGLNVKWLERLIFCLLLASLIVGIRSVGVILMSGMIIAPAVAARQFTHHLHRMFFLASFFGALSGLLGNFLSIWGSMYLSTETERMTLPTGPSIVLVGSCFAFLSLLFAPQRGLVSRLFRIGAFRLRRLEENILKYFWKKGTLSRKILHETLHVPMWALFLVLRRLKKQGWIEGAYSLTPDGMKRAASIVRLHRLWELYLTEQLKLETGKVHKTAEEMEHILTPDLEERLTHLLGAPTQDPHQQPIPEKSRFP